MKDQSLNVNPAEKRQNNRFYKLTNGAYWVGFITHGSAIPLFWLIDVPELMWINIVFSLPMFGAALLLNRRGHYNLAFILAFLELLSHQIASCYYLGWNMGAHYWLIYLAGLCFFNANWKSYIQFGLLSIIIGCYALLFMYTQEPIYSSIDKYMLLTNLSNGLTVIFMISILINYYSKSTNRAEKQLIKEQENTKKMSDKIESLLSQQVSQEIAQEMIFCEKELIARRYEATIMFMDIRDFTVFADSREPEEVSQFQNKVFSALIEIVGANSGVVLQLLGDGIMAVFGAPKEDSDHAKNAVKAGYEMLEKIQKMGDSKLIPQIRLGIGLNSGQVVAGNIGNEQRRSYSLTGKNVIIAARIEPLNKKYASQFLISESVYVHSKDVIKESQDLGLLPMKGIEQPVRVYKLV